jgi:hypothetical protein
MCIRYKDKKLFDLLMEKTINFGMCSNRDIIRLLTALNAFERLTSNETTYNEDSVAAALMGGSSNAD